MIVSRKSPIKCSIRFSAKTSEAKTSETLASERLKPFSEYYSNQLRRFLQGLPGNFNPELYRQSLGDSAAREYRLVDKKTLLPMPEMDAKWFLNESTLRALFLEIGQAGSEDLLPILSLVKESRWHPTLFWLKPDENGSLIQLNFPQNWVAQLKQRLLPDLQNAMDAIAIRSRQS